MAASQLSNVSFVPDDNSDNDSAFDEINDHDFTASIINSILKYREENGRTYNSYEDNSYLLPYDRSEMDRLDIQHHVLQLLYDGKLSLVPTEALKRARRVLDVGTGSGIWAIDYADEHPEAQVIGVDVCPTQPNFIPSNVSFQLDDLEKPWTFNQKFDFIHSRMMTGSFQNWPRFFQQCYDNLAPGGYLELQDIVFPAQADDNTMPPTSALRNHSELMLEASAVMGSRLDSGKQYHRYLAEAGFEGIVQDWKKVPMNSWPKDKKMKEIGIWTLENLGSEAECLSVALWVRVLGGSVEELASVLVDVKNEMEDRKIHAYWPVVTVYAHKPASA